MTRQTVPLAFLTVDTHPADRASATLAAMIADASSGFGVEDSAELQRLLHHIVLLGRTAGVGVPVALAARQLGVSQPTVRSWIARGALDTVPNRSPVRVTADSLGEALAAVAELRRLDATGPLAGRVVEVLQDRRTRAELADRIAELDDDDWTSIDPNNLDELFS